MSEVTVQEQNDQALAELSNTSSELAVFDPTSGTIPDLGKAEASPISDVSEYWTPEEIGETKRVFFDCMAIEDVEDPETGEVRKLPAVILWEQKDGELRKVSNSSARLVGHFNRSNYINGTPLQITYKGKERNKNNSYSSDTWDVHRLIIK